MILEVKDLSFSYGKKETLKNINLQVESGETVALLGKNGSGKSTLLKNILYLLTPSSGEITVDGKDVSSMSIKERSRLLSYIPQESRNIYSYSVLSYVLMGVTPTLSTLSSPKDKDEDAALKALDFFGIRDLKDRDITTLSGGERQLVTASRALVGGSRILLFDEPTSALDYGNSECLLNLIKKLSNNGYISIISMHSLTEALNTASRIVLMKDGMIIFGGSVEELIKTDILSDYYGTSITVEYYKGQYIVLKGERDVVE
ncbi:MAG: ABC transporter ATP-binding protein [Bullifex sp.]